MAHNSPIRIAVDARTLSMPNTGVAIFTLSVLEPLLKAGFEVTLLTNAPLQTDSPLVANCKLEILPGSHRVYWEQVTLWRYLSKNSFDIYFASWNWGLPKLYRGKTKLVLAVLDLIPYVLPDIYLRSPLLKFRFVAQTRQSIRQADKVITISESAARDIEDFAPGTKAYVYPIPVRTSGVASGKRGSYFVYSGGVDPRKQIGSMLAGFALFHAKHPDFTFKLVGKNYGVFNDQISSLGLSKAVQQTGYLSTEDKFKTIAEATGLIYPSIYEGFGLNVAEAIVSGTPVITSNNSSLPEVGGDAVLYADPTKAEEIAAAMEQLLDPKVVARLEAAMAKRKPLLEHPKQETEIVNVFKEVLT
jgi:glycosyltransferase involved in cell wall biosynthesis